MERRAFMSLRRSIASSRSLSCVSYLSFSELSTSFFSRAARSSPLFSSSRSFSTAPTASLTASFFAVSSDSSLALRL
ncbi:hypothetical protein ACFPRL_32205 [Pseudoclavibacter helvolus]